MVYLLLTNGFEETEAVTVIDLLRRADIQIKTVSMMDDRQVYGAHGIAVESDILFKEGNFESCAMLILPGGMPGTTNLCNSKPLKEVLEDFKARNKPVAAICAAPMVLGQMGMLEDREATIYPGMEEHLIGAIARDARVVVSKNIITAKGPGTAVDFALAIISYIKGATVEMSIRDDIVY